MMRRVWVPDPGRLRLRAATRAVLGIGLATTASGLAVPTLTGAIAGGLAALLALFTVADPTVRGQAVTTALLPVVGLPVLALAAGLHGHPLGRDAAFLAVVGAGGYARRWGPRGHALGIFAFMMFFMAQFLHAEPGRLPPLIVAVLVGAAVAAAIRFGAWCYERGLRPAPAPAPPPPGRGLDRATTRQAVQATVACAAALAVGQAVSADRWYWAVATVWWIFVNTASCGETLVRGFRRVLGTVTGIAAGLLVAVPLHGAPAPTAALVAVCIFGLFHTAPLSYTYMMFFVTVMAGLLYGLLGVLHPGLLALRLAETGVGALATAVAVVLVLPVTTHATTNAWIQRAVRCVHECTAQAVARLGGAHDADPAGRTGELEALLGKVRLSLAPLLHPLNPLRHRKARARQVLALLDACAHDIAALAALAPAGRTDGAHGAHLADAWRRVEAAVETLTARHTAPVPAPAPPAAGDGPLLHLHGLEQKLAALAAPLASPPRAPLAGA
ncbi:FUSC family protein [Streptomyces sp. NBC_01525]|uniref:FUSC family protein n=1 Tax=Streptomyces sp. NBC_01525 TaxID=2903893 RepID=UPI00386FD47D